MPGQVLAYDHWPTITRPRPCRKLTESFQKIIDEILVSDQSAPKKQHHTAKQIFDRLQAEHGFSGGYDAVRRYVKKQRTGARETFLPISIEAGQRAEADFGKIEVDFPEGRRSVSVLMITWAYSGAVFAIAVPSEKVEASGRKGCRVKIDDVSRLTVYSVITIRPDNC